MRLLLLVLAFLAVSQAVQHASQQDIDAVARFQQKYTRGNMHAHRAPPPPKKKPALDDAGSSDSSSSNTGDVLSDSQVQTIRQAVVQVLTSEGTFDWQQPWNTGAVTDKTGSGFFVKLDDNPYIVTNAHVVENAMETRIRVPALGSEEIDVNVFAICHSKDIALLQVDDAAWDDFETAVQEAGQGISYLSFGDSDKFSQGATTIAVGYPLGQANLKFSMGILSGMEHVDKKFYLQTTSPINPGNSGGPLLNSDGEVVGINTAAIEDASNVGYALPQRHFIELITSWDRAASLEEEDAYADLIEYGADGFSDATIVKFAPVLGAALDSTTASTNDYLGYTGNGGARLRQLGPRGFFADAGAQVGDLILSFDGYELDRFGQALPKTALGSSVERMTITDIAERIEIGKTVEIEVFRDGQKQTLEALYKFDPERHLYPIRTVREPLLQDIEYECFGGMVFMQLTMNHVTLTDAQDFPVNPQLNEYESNIALTNTQRVVVSTVFSDAMVPTSTILGGDVVKTINGEKVNTLAELRAAFEPEMDNDSSDEIYWVMETDGEEGSSLLVLNYGEALEAEIGLSTLYGYDHTAAVVEAFSNYGLTMDESAEEDEEDDDAQPNDTTADADLDSTTSEIDEETEDDGDAEPSDEDEPESTFEEPAVENTDSDGDAESTDGDDSADGDSESADGNDATVASSTSGSEAATSEAGSSASGEEEEEEEIDMSASTSSPTSSTSSTTKVGGK